MHRKSLPSIGTPSGTYNSVSAGTPSATNNSVLKCGLCGTGRPLGTGPCCFRGGRSRSSNRKELIPTDWPICTVCGVAAKNMAKHLARAHRKVDPPAVVDFPAVYDVPGADVKSPLAPIEFSTLTRTMRKPEPDGQRLVILDRVAEVPMEFVQQEPDRRIDAVAAPIILARLGADDDVERG